MGYERAHDGLCGQTRCIVLGLACLFKGPLEAIQHPRNVFIGSGCHTVDKFLDGGRLWDHQQIVRVMHLRAVVQLCVSTYRIRRLFDLEPHLNSSDVPCVQDIASWAESGADAHLFCTLLGFVDDYRVWYGFVCFYAYTTMVFCYESETNHQQ